MSEFVLGTSVPYFYENPAALEAVPRTMECSESEEKLECILTYAGSKNDIAINYSVLFATLIASSVVLRTHCYSPSANFICARLVWMIIALLGLTAFQITLCFSLGCSGISIIWNAMDGFLVANYWQRKKYSDENLNANNSLNLVMGHACVAVGLAADIYYAILSEILTTVAHVCAVLLGMLLYLVYTYSFRGQANSSIAQESIALIRDGSNES